MLFLIDSAYQERNDEVEKLRQNTIKIMTKRWSDKRNNNYNKISTMIIEVQETIDSNRN